MIRNRRRARIQRHQRITRAEARHRRPTAHLDAIARLTPQRRQPAHQRTPLQPRPIRPPIALPRAPPEDHNQRVLPQLERAVIAKAQPRRRPITRRDPKTHIQRLPRHRTRPRARRRRPMLHLAHDPRHPRRRRQRRRQAQHLAGHQPMRQHRTKTRIELVHHIPPLAIAITAPRDPGAGITGLDDVIGERDHRPLGPRAGRQRNEDEARKGRKQERSRHRNR